VGVGVGVGVGVEVCVIASLSLKGEMDDVSATIWKGERERKRECVCMECGEETE
jgi:hypothetical protein